VASLLRLFTFIQFILQGIDFNGDNFPDEIKILIKAFLVSDEISIGGGGGGAGDSPNPPAPSTTRKKRRANPEGGAEGAEDGSLDQTFTKETSTVPPKVAYDKLRPELVKAFGGKKCCAILGYVYHNLSPKTSYATLGMPSTQKFLAFYREFCSQSFLFQVGSVREVTMLGS